MSSPRLLLVGGWDPLGYSGLQADVRNAAAVGVETVAVVTALTEQTATALRHPGWVPLATVLRTIDLVLAEAPVDAVKIGLLGDGSILDHLADRVPAATPIVLDPVLATGRGDRFGPPHLGDSLRRSLGRVTLVTPNGPELSALAHLPVATMDEAVIAAQELLTTGVRAILVKGGHLVGALEDRLITPTASISFPGERLPDADVRGTGCALATLCAALLARGRTLPVAVEQALLWVRVRIADALRRGSRRLRVDLSAGRTDPQG